MRSKNVVQKVWKMGVFLEKLSLFTGPLCIQQNVLAWKMIARHHSRVHRTLRQWAREKYSCCGSRR